MRKDLVQTLSQTLRNHQILGKQGVPNPRVEGVHRRKTKLYLKPRLAWANHVFVAL